MGLQEDIESIEEEIANTPYNKSTEAHIGRLKSKLAQKKEKFEKQQSGGGGGHGYAVEKHGDASVALVGFPSVGKSTLINAMTNADSETGEYEFTTLTVNPGMVDINGAHIQMLDVPGLIEGAADGRGGGKEVLSVVRSADLLVFVLSVFEIEQYDRLMDELYNTKVRVDQTKPRVTIRKKIKDGIKVTSTVEQDMDDDTIKQILREHGYVNADINLGEKLTIDRLIDGIMDNRVYTPSIVAVNKADLIDPDYKSHVDEELRKRDINPEKATFISAVEEKGLDALKERIWNHLGLIRVYMDKPSRGVDWEEPLVVKEGSTIEEALSKLGGDFEERFRFARVRGPSAKHDGQQVGEDHVLEDEDVLKLILRK
ncbi:OBG GTPase family GTP-binding protein [Haloarchaeobius sp. DFWS5]|uniref:OBG GTPase family GTP-binding protein n=1 Tax=Haloarchaeobius sp. DFWS5 TaxID=3446114 RepID=UPI003EBE6373